MPSTWTPRRASQQAAGRRPVMTKPQAVARCQAWRLLTGHRPQRALVPVCRKTRRKAARASGTASGKAGRKTVKSNSRTCPRQGLNSPQARTVPSGAVACRSRRPGALTRRSQSSSRGSAQAYMAQPVSPSRHMRAKRAFRPASSRTASRRKASCTPAWPQCRVFVCSIRAPAVCGVTEGDECGPPPAAATPSRNESGAAVSRGSPLSRRVSRYGRCRGRSRRQLPPAMPLPRGGDRAPFIVPAPARHS